MAETILVIGATGRLGAPVARHLHDGGYTVRIMARGTDTAAARRRFGESYEVVQGDVLDTDSLEKALDGCFGVHISISGDAEQVGTENVSSIAGRIGLGRITYISGANTFEENAWFETVRQKLNAERAVRQSGVPYTILCPSFAMDVLPMHVQGGRAVVFGKQPHPLHWVAGEDIGRMVLGAYRDEQTEGKKLFIHGPELIRTHEAVRRYCAAAHPDVEKVSTMPYWLGNMIAKVTRNKGMKAAVEAYSFVEKVGEQGDPTETNELLGKPDITLEDWISARGGA